MSLELWGSLCAVANPADERDTPIDSISYGGNAIGKLGDGWSVAQQVPHGSASEATVPILIPGPELTWTEHGLGLALKLQAQSYGETLADSCTLESFLARCSGCSADIDAQGLLLRPSLLPLPPGASAAAASDAAPPAPAQAGDPEAAPDAPEPAEAGVLPAASKPTAPTQAGKPRAAPEPPAPLLVWRATPDGCSVKGGTVRVGDGAVLLLDGKGASFEGTTFSGGSIICAGAHFSATFHGCTFDNCTLHAVHGAAVTAHSTTFTAPTPTPTTKTPGDAAATPATTPAEIVQQSTDLPTEDHAATPPAEFLTPGHVHSTRHAVVVYGAGAKVDLKDATITGAVLVSHGAAAMLSGCRLDMRMHAAAARTHAAAARTHAAAAVRVVTGTLTADACEVTGTRVRSGEVTTPASGEGSGAGQAQASVGYVCEGGLLEVKNGGVHLCGVGVQIVATSGNGQCGAVKLNGVEFDACETSVVVEKGCCLEAQGCLVCGDSLDAAAADSGTDGPAAAAAPSAPQRRPQQRGVVLAAAKSAVLRECDFQGNDVDVDVTAAVAEGVKVKHCTFSGTRKGGSCVLVTGRAVVEDSSFSNAGCGVTVSAKEVCAVQRCEFGPCMDMGVWARIASRVDVRDSKFHGCEVGMKAGAKSKLEVTKCTFSATAVGIDASGGGFKVTGTCVDGSCSTAVVRLSGAGDKCASACLQVCEFTQSGKAVWVRGHNMKASVTESQFRSCGIGVHAEGATNTAVGQCTMSTCNRGVVIGQLPEEMGGRCDVCGLGGRKAKACAWHALSLAGGRFVTGARCPHQGALTYARVEDATIDDSTQEGVYVTAYGCGNVTGCFDYCGVGVKEVFIGGRSKFFAHAMACGSDGAVFGAKAYRLLGPEAGFEMVEESISGVTMLEPMMRQEPENFM